MSHGRDEQDQTVVRKSITIGRETAEVYRAFVDGSFVAQFAEHLDSATEETGGAWHWMSTTLAGSSGHGTAEVIDEEPNAYVRWRWLEDGDERGQGTARFRPAPGLRGTEVAVELEYDARGGAPGRWVEKLLGTEPGQQLLRDLFRFRQLLETGEIATTVGQPAAREMTGGVLVSAAGQPSGRVAQ